MKEYTIYSLNHNAIRGLNSYSFDNVESAKLKLYEMLEIKDRYNSPYYVDNDFFENKYPNSNTHKWFTYFCIREREITPWKKYSSTQEKLNNNTNEKSNIINFLDFCI